MVPSNQENDFATFPRAPSMAMEEQECFPLSPFHNAPFDSDETDDTTSSSFSNGHSSHDDSSNDISFPTHIEVPDTHEALLTQLRQELYEEESCLQLNFDGTACVCHDEFPDFSKALLKKKHGNKSKSPRKKSRRGRRLLNLMHHAQ